jgi:AraC-like DNA-binding protein
MATCFDHLPSRQLQEYIESLWFTEAAAGSDCKVVPDGCVDVCFVLSERRPSIEVFGATTRLSTYRLEADTAYCGIRFRPGMAAMLLSEPVAELTDTSRIVTHFLGLSADEIFDAEGFGEQRNKLESTLIAALSHVRRTASTGYVTHAIETINQQQGRVRIREIAKGCGVSERHLERSFLRQVGISPKMYARIQRFRAVLDHLTNHNHQMLADVAAEYGYADQSHFIRDFRAFMPSAPSDVVSSSALAPER